MLTLVSVKLADGPLVTAELLASACGEGAEKDVESLGIVVTADAAAANMALKQ